MHDLRDVGGTRGGLGMFLMGLAMAVLGGYLLMDRVTVFGGYWGWFGTAGASFGVTLIPLLFGVGILFYSGRSIVGWILTGAGLIVIFGGVLANMRIHFQATSLFNTLVMLVLLVGGLGLIFRSLAPVGRAKD